jgi:alkylation response protein AidB-like acyl-CoA dehydrogenase
MATDIVGRVADEASQIHCGYGYTQSLTLERHMRDARFMRICEGTSEIQRNIISRSLLNN